MEWFSLDDAADRAAVESTYVRDLLDLGILKPRQSDLFSSGDIRRISMAKSLEDAGISLATFADGLRGGSLSLDFLDAAVYERFSSRAPETFQQVSDRTGVPFELLTIIREAMGLPQPSPGDRLREDEMEIVPLLEVHVSEGFRNLATERLLRVFGDSMRRVAESEGAWWRSEILAPALAGREGPEAAAPADTSSRITSLGERVLLAIYHAQQTRVWTANFIESFEVMMAEAGIHSLLDRPPAMCFLDITGYTRLTQEQGDDTAAEVAATVARVVQRSSVQHGGKLVKWLGDGVMFYFRDPGPGVIAALEMLDGLAGAGLPPAHVGLHAGPVLFQEGDYFGQTVNVAARIADYARPGEVLVSQAVADSDQPGIEFSDIGPTELKGVGGTVHLFRALRLP